MGLRHRRRSNPRRFAMVHQLDAKPRKRVAAVLESQNLDQRQTVRFISDGGDTVRNLQRYLHAEVEHVLDWFHLTMRITVMRHRGRPPQLDLRGSDSGGRRAAAIYTLIETCRLNDVDPRAWLADVLERLPGHPSSRLEELLPWNWNPIVSQQAA